MKKVHIVAIVVIAIVVVASLGYSAWQIYFPAKSVPTKIRLGYPGFLTGAGSYIGTAVAWGVNVVVNEINANGGVYVEEYGTKIPLEVIILDTESSNVKATEVATSLILDYGVTAILDLNPPWLFFPIASVCEQYKVPCLGASAYVEAFNASGPWTYCWDSSTSLVESMNMWLDVTNMYCNSTTNKKVALFCLADSDGNTIYDAAAGLLKANGYTPIELGTFSADLADFSSYILRWKSEGAEILWTNCVAAQFSTMWTQAVKFGWWPKIAIGGRLWQDISELEALGNLGVGLMPELLWTPSFTEDSMKIAEAFTEATSRYWVTQVADAWIYIRFIAAAIEQAGTLDKEAINNAIGETVLTDTVIGTVQFDKETHTHVRPVALGQWEKVSTEPFKQFEWTCQTVYSLRDWISTTASITYPLPSPT
jgi:branched-chain amino acid transport system substrate-binding protein